MTTTKTGSNRTPTKMIYNNFSDALHQIKTKQLGGMNPREIRTLITGSAATIAPFADRLTKEQLSGLGKKVVEIAKKTFDGDETAWANFYNNDALFGTFLKAFAQAGGDQIFDDMLDRQHHAPSGAPVIGVIGPQSGLGEGVFAR